MNKKELLILIMALIIIMLIISLIILMLCVFLTISNQQFAACCSKCSSDPTDNEEIIDEIRLKRMGIPDDEIKNFPKQFGDKFQNQFNI